MTPASSCPPHVLRVYTPPGYVEERRWVLKVLFEEHLGYELQWVEEAEPEVRRRLGDAEGRGLWRRSMLEREWTLLVTADDRALWLADGLFSLSPDRWLSAGSVPTTLRGEFSGNLDGGENPLAVLFGEPLEIPDAASWKGATYRDRDGALWAAALPAEASATELPADLLCAADPLGAAFFWLSRYEERALAQEDVFDLHGRFPADQSWMGRHGLLGRALVDEWADQLDHWLQKLGAAPRPSREYELELSHDVDHPLAGVGRGLTAMLRGSAGDLLAGEVVSAARRVGAWATRSVSLDPYNTFDWLMERAESVGQRAAFFFMAGATPGRPDGSYRLTDPFVLDVMREVHRRGHEIGLHPSYETATDADLLGRELEALRSAAATAGLALPQVLGGRQHYLRWRATQTWRQWAQAGLEYDSTLGFADVAGFRCGTCRPYTAFDLESGEPLALREIPLVVMEVTLSSYQRLSWGQALESIEELGAVCRRHRGTMSLLWHNSSLGNAAARRCYAEAVKVLAP
ncbi:MAG: hypothetical protein AAGD01_00855 [Acidobacteriota bacterium]